MHNPSNFILMRMLAALLFGFLLQPLAAADSRQSAHYGITTEVMDSGGGPRASVNYAENGSIGGFAGDSISGEYVLLHGFGATETGGILDIDGNGITDALTDGMLLLRYLFGRSGTALTMNVVGTGCLRCNHGVIEDRLHTDIGLSLFDVDINGSTDPITDGLIILRFLFGFRDAPLIDQALAADATRRDPSTIALYLESLLP